LAECLTNPCNCGQGQRTETWNGVSNTFDKNSICPPWNRQSGRDNGTCILKLPYPGNFTPWHIKYCAEQTSESDYFNPKIRIRTQTCNIFACWTLAKSLNYNGQCLIWPNPWGLPLLRICARIAVPANPGIKIGEVMTDSTPADPGYTKGVHLNSEGAEVGDKILYDDDNQPILFDHPKLCAYKDPGLLDGATDITTFISGKTDIFDWNPVNQVFHNTGELHPIAKVIIFFVEKVLGGTATSLTDLLSTLFDKLGQYIPGIQLFKYILEALGWLIEKFIDILVAILKEFGQFNRVVDTFKFGCVELPLGPFPPPYCPKLSAFTPVPTTQAVCQTDANTGLPVQSTEDNLCVVSKLVNNVVRNSIRITIDNFVPLCKPGIDPATTDKCVTISNLDSFGASAMHTLTARRDYIKHCSNATGGQPCINSKLPFSCSVSNNGCEDGFRLVYALTIGQSTFPSGYYRDDLPDCTGVAGQRCQGIWGINTGEYIDTELAFPAIQTPSILPLTQSATLKDTNGNNRIFVASIYTQSTYLPSLSFPQEQDQLCVVEGGTG
jgi:hypothetical protein